MRIGINASFLRKPGTGIGQVTEGFLRQLFAGLGTADGHEYILYLEQERDDFTLPQNVKKRVVLPWWRRDDLIRKYLWERRVLPREARRDGCEAFLSLYQSASIFPEEMFHVMVVHDIIPELFPEYQGNIRKAGYWKSVKQGIGHASRIIAVSQTTKDDIGEYLGIPEGRISVAYPSIAPVFKKELTEDAVQSVLARYGLEPGYLYHGGGLEIRKNTETLLRAYAGLLKKGASVPPLVISGTIHSTSNPLATDVARIIAELGIGHQVKLLGFVPEANLPALYRGAKLFIYPSLYEGFGLPVLEALASGTPVITTRGGALPEVAESAARYIDPENEEEMQGAILALLEEREERERLSLAGRGQAEKFDWEHFTRAILETFEK
ncbi:MAG: hypothetical protein A2808_00380 [Candidatus Moranbacteria bacterium RIFCSPHIGHO2_01_FULL_55_24]|nr:MAG: hypothetical protein A2808_00380 [Candidatus Moranbacteria bacterium RIFCSPHIGHO2_01_FULL_55_24]